ncbi:MAG: hypothetical protein GXP24_01250 [Planctomycetes bacterium]|nr:hypothetical protein [Planctomycetota bacterium]
MPSVFEHSGLRFEYPENWVLEAASEDHLEQVVVSSPNTGFWHLSKYPRDSELETLFDEALAALRTEYQDMETEPAGDLQVEDRLLMGFDVRFICLDLTNTCWLRGFQTDDATYLLLCQAEDREFAQVSPVFQAMLASLLRHCA